MWNLDYFIDKVPLRIQVAILIVSAATFLTLFIVTHKNLKNSDSESKKDD